MKLELRHPTDAGKAPLTILEAMERPCPHELDPLDPLRESALGYDVRLSNEHQYHVRLYIVYTDPEAVAHADGAVAYRWKPVLRSHCYKNCQGPILRAIQRFGKLGRRCGKECADKESWKDPKFLFVSIDEACTHVAAHQYPGDAKRCKYRILSCVYDSFEGGRLLSAGVSPPIKVLANNDVPGGAAFITLTADIDLDEAEWVKGPPRPRRAPLKALDSNAPPKFDAAGGGEPQRPRSERARAKREAQKTPPAAGPAAAAAADPPAVRIDSVPHAGPSQKRVRLEKQEFRQQAARRLSGKFAATAAAPGGAGGAAPGEAAATASHSGKVAKPSRIQARAPAGLRLDPADAKPLKPFQQESPERQQEALAAALAAAQAYPAQYQSMYLATAAQQQQAQHTPVDPRALAYLQMWQLWYGQQLSQSQAAGLQVPAAPAKGDGSLISPTSVLALPTESPAASTPTAGPKPTPSMPDTAAERFVTPVAPTASTEPAPAGGGPAAA